VYAAAARRFYSLLTLVVTATQSPPSIQIIKLHTWSLVSYFSSVHRFLPQRLMSCSDYTVVASGPVVAVALIMRSFFINNIQVYLFLRVPSHYGVLLHVP